MKIQTPFRPLQTDVLASTKHLLVVLFISLFSNVQAQNTPSGGQDHPIIITGARFSYPLLQKWIDDYNKLRPDVQIIIESRGSNDPKQYDILAEGYEPSEEIKKEREYVYVGRYAILPVAVSHSRFAKIFKDKGLTQDLINQLFFHDITADKSKEEDIRVPYTIYTRLQRAGVPIVFTNYFGYEQKDIKGKAIAGSDEHLLIAFLRDSTGVTYLPLPLAFDLSTAKPRTGLTILPVDLNGNGRVSEDEKIYDDLSSVILKLEKENIRDVHNLPISYLHLSVRREGADPKAIAFLQWVAAQGSTDLHDFGYLVPERTVTDKNAFESKRTRP